MFSATSEREDEAYTSATELLADAAERENRSGGFKDGSFPYQGAELKCWFEALKSRVAPDVILSHWKGDPHEDHREISQLTWNTFRDHLILEYEIRNGTAISGCRTSTSLPQDGDGAQGRASS